MLPFLLAGLAIVGIGMLSGCGGHCPIAPPPPSPPPEKPRKPFPEDPDPDDILAHAPCAVKTEPDIVFKNSLWSDETKRKWEKTLHGDLEKMKKINPTFLCALDRIELMEEVEHTKLELDPHSAGFYDPKDRFIGIRWYNTRYLFHEIGHHVHHLGILAPLVKDFRDISWRQDGQTQEWKLKEITDDAFVTDYAKKDFKEDWAETFSFATSGQALEGLHFYLTPSEKQSALQKKFELLNRQIPFLLPADPK